MAYIGDTVRLGFYFEDADGVRIDVSDVSVTFFDTKRVQVGETVFLNDKIVEVGYYALDYTIPDVRSNLVAEFKAVSKTNGKTYLHRDTIEVVWTKNKGGSISF